MDDREDLITEYEAFADCYDELMGALPYEAWGKRIVDTIEKYGISKPDRDEKDPVKAEANLVLDLACGTGTLSEYMYGAGYDVIGIDASPDMLGQALIKRDESGSEILYLQQDMRELDLYCTVGTVFCVCDSLNYMLSEDELKDVFKGVHLFLQKDGLFIFDINTDHKYREALGDRVFASAGEETSYIWENSYNTDDCTNEYRLSMFILNDEGTYDRYDELHIQRGYSDEQVRKLLSETGFEIVSISDSDKELLDRFPDEDAKKLDQRYGDKDTERYFVVARCIK